MFNAVVMNKDEDSGLATASVEQIGLDQLPEGNVTVAVEYSTVNYKDGLCLSPKGGGLVRKYPHVPGIDFAGTVEDSADDRYQPGDKAIPRKPGSMRIGWCLCRPALIVGRPWR